MDRPLVAVVLAGGTGTRLYPAARTDRPKQFLSFGGDRSLLGRTVDRAAFCDATVVLTRSAYSDRIAEHAPDAEVMIEPAPRDTGPALVYAAHVLGDRFTDPVLAVLPSDHRVDGDLEAVVRRAGAVATDTGDLVALGVPPDRPETGYGYVVPGRPLGPGGFAVDRFVEKPSAGRARTLIDAGALWNAGMFVWTPEALLREARASPLAPVVEAVERGEPDAGFDAVDPVSIDRAVLERTDRAAVVPADFDWDDLGTWAAVARAVDEPLSAGLEIDAEGNLLASDGAHLTVIGASNLVVAAFDDRVLVADLDRPEAVREAVARLRADGVE